MSGDLPAIGWKTSSRSNRTYCVEVVSTDDGAAVRDSKDRTAGHITASAAQWWVFVAGIKAGLFDR